MAFESLFKPKLTGTIFDFADVSGSPKETGYYGNGWAHGINQSALMSKILNLPEKETVLTDFYYKHFVGRMIVVESTIKRYDDFYSTTKTETVITDAYINKKGISINTSCRLNKKIGDVEKAPNVGINIDLHSSSTKFQVHFGYVEGTQLVDDDETFSTGTFDVDQKELKDGKIKINAIEFTTYSYDVLLALLDDFGDEKKIEPFVMQKYLTEYERIGENLELLDNFYRQIPVSILMKIFLNDQLYQDLVRLLEYDANSSWDDSSTSMLKTLAAFTDMQFVYNKLYDDPTTAKSIYDHINTDTGPVSTEAYLTFLMMLCLAYQEYKIEDLVVIKHGENFTYGAHYLTDSTDMFLTNIRLSDQRTMYAERVHALQLVILKNVDNNETLVVPVLYLRRLRDIENWELILDTLFNVLNLIAMFSSFGILMRGASALLKAFAVTDILISGTDIIMSNDEVEAELRKYGEAGNWFADNWQVISFVSNVGILSTQIVTGIIKFGPGLVESMTNITLKSRISELVYLSALKQRYAKSYSYVELLVKPDIKIIRALFKNNSELVVNLIKAVEKQHLSILKLNENILPLVNKELILAAGMTDPKTGLISKVFSNFSQAEIHNGAHKIFIENMHPTLLNRYKDHLFERGIDGAKLNLNNPSDIDWAWRYDEAGNFIPHAEIRALDDLLKQISKFTKQTELDDVIIDQFIGYNSHLRTNKIMCACADCAYITSGVTYIK